MVTAPYMLLFSTLTFGLAVALWHGPMRLAFARRAVGDRGGRDLRLLPSHRHVSSSSSKSTKRSGLRRVLRAAAARRAACDLPADGKAGAARIPANHGRFGGRVCLHAALRLESRGNIGHQRAQRMASLEPELAMEFGRRVDDCRVLSRGERGVPQPYLGDAARYFRGSPANVAVRREIRKQTVDLLDRLHASAVTIGCCCRAQPRKRDRIRHAARLLQPDLRRVAVAGGAWPGDRRDQHRALAA